MGSQRPLNWALTFELLSLDISAEYLDLLGIPTTFHAAVQEVARHFVSDIASGPELSKNEAAVGANATAAMASLEALGGERLINPLEAVVYAMSCPPSETENEADWSILFDSLASDQDPVLGSKRWYVRACAVIEAVTPSSRERESLKRQSSELEAGKGAAWDLSVNSMVGLAHSNVVELLAYAVDIVTVRRALTELGSRLSPLELDLLVGWAHDRQEKNPLRYGGRPVTIWPPLTR